MHTYLSVSDASSERTIAVPDSLLELLLYCWLESVDYGTLTPAQREVVAHYAQELPRGNHSFMDLQLAEIHATPSLTPWYLSTLTAVQRTLEALGPTIDHQFLHELARWPRQYEKPIAVSVLSDLLNDLRWLLHQQGVQPSGHFKWFAEGSSGPAPDRSSPSTRPE